AAGLLAESGSHKPPSMKSRATSQPQPNPARVYVATLPVTAQFPPRPRRELPRAGSRRLLFVENPLVQVVHDEAGQPLVMHKQALADRVGILFCNGNPLVEDLLGASAALDVALDEADPILDDLGLFLEIRLAAGFAVAR